MLNQTGQHWLVAHKSGTIHPSASCTTMPPPSYPLHCTSTVHIRHCTYHLSYTADPTSCKLELGTTPVGGTALQWTSKFTSTYITEMTTKTGHPLSYHQFNDWFTTAMQQQQQRSAGGSAYDQLGGMKIDVLTMDDLQAIKRQKQGLTDSTSTPIPTADPTAPINSKRYIILSVGEDTNVVHYPLPVKIQVQKGGMTSSNLPSPANTAVATKPTASTSSYATNGTASTSTHQLQQENRSLRAEIDQLRAELHAVTIQPVATNDSNAQLVTQLQSHVKELQQKHDKAQQQLKALQATVHDQQKQLRQSEAKAEELRLKCRSLEAQARLQRPGARSRSTSVQRSTNGVDRQGRPLDRGRSHSRVVSRSPSARSLQQSSSTQSIRSDSSTRRPSSREVSSRLYNGSRSNSRSSSLSRTAESPINRGRQLGDRNNSLTSSDRFGSTTSSLRTASPSMRNSTRYRSPSPAASRSMRSCSSSKTRSTYDPTEFVRRKEERARSVSRQREREKEETIRRYGSRPRGDASLNSSMRSSPSASTRSLPPASSLNLSALTKSIVNNLNVSTHGNTKPPANASHSLQPHQRHISAIDTPHASALTIQPTPQHLVQQRLQQRQQQAESNELRPNLLTVNAPAGTHSTLNSSRQMSADVDQFLGSLEVDASFGKSRPQSAAPIPVHEPTLIAVAKHNKSQVSSPVRSVRAVEEQKTSARSTSSDEQYDEDFITAPNTDRFAQLTRQSSSIHKLKAQNLSSVAEHGDRPQTADLTNRLSSLKQFLQKENHNNNADDGYQL